ncbi:MAG: peptidylprolyl isomerase [Alphaproteobacteria bacterium]|nr:peptidylprolyl isomerase [Alphaproteobacteria bacterium]
MRTKKLFPLILTFIALSLPFSARAADSFAIAATVNKDAISDSDVLDRMKLIFASSGVTNNKENRAEAYPQALNSLIEEQLQIQEAERQQLAVTEEDIAEGFEGMAKQNSMTAEQFELVLSQQGIPKSTILQKIKAQTAWRNVVTKVLRPQIDVTENDVKARMDRIKENVGKEEYQVAQIFLPVTETSQEKETEKLAEKLISEIRSDRVQFSVVAAQFSKDSSARQGGLLGWVQAGQLPQELDIVVKSLAVKQVSPPIRSLSGYHIFKLLDKRTISSETLPPEEDVLNAIGLERLDRLQQRYLSDIRSAAFIDRRSE